MKKLVLLMVIVCMAIPCFAGSPFNIWTRPDADWLTGQTPNFDPAWAWMKWMDGMVSPPGDVFYVSNDNGSATNDGLSWNRAKATITQGMALITKNHSTLYVGGTSYQENVITPTGVSGGRILGVSNSRGLPLWQAASTTGDVHLTIISPEWEVAGFRFHGSTNNVTYLRVHSNVGSSYNAHAAVIRDNWFSGATAYAGIEFVGGPTSCKIFRNKFTGFTTGGAWGGAVSGNDYVQASVLFEIVDNFFANNTKNINLLMNNCLVKGNTFTTAAGYAATTIIISTYSGVGAGAGGGGGNVITENYFPHKTFEINAAHGYESSTTDNWMGNFCTDGLTKGIPHYPRYFTVTADFESGTWNTQTAHEIAEVTGNVRMQIMIQITEDVVTASNDGTLSLGFAGNTADIIAATDIDGGAGDLNVGIVTAVYGGSITSVVGGTEAQSALIHSIFDVVVVGGVDVGYTIATNNASDGILIFHIWWEPLDSDGLVTAGAGGGF